MGTQCVQKALCVGLLCFIVFASKQTKNRVPASCKEIVGRVTSLMVNSVDKSLYINVLLETKCGESLQAPSPQMTLGERKRKGPRVLVNKLNVNHDIIERLRRITKMCGKEMAAGKTQSQTAEMSEAGGSNPAENKKEITNGSHSVKEEEKRALQEGSTEPSKHSTPSKC